MGMAEVCMGSARRCFASARQPSELLEIPHSAMERLLTLHPELATVMMAQLGERLRLAGDTLLAVATASATARLARLLLVLAQRPGASHPVRMVQDSYTQQELASMSGLSRQTASEVLSRFRRQGLIDVRDRHMVLVRPAELRHLAGL